MSLQKLEEYQMFTYSSHIDEKQDETTVIRIYGLDKQNNTVCVRVENFTPYVYLELPHDINWTESKAQVIGNKIDELLGKQKALSKSLIFKHKLFGGHLNADGTRKLFPYLFCCFSHTKDIKALGFKIRKDITAVGIGKIRLKMHEDNASPILQLFCCRNIPTCGWCKFVGKRVENEYEKLTSCTHEFIVKWKNIFPYECNIVPRPTIMVYDLEVNSSNPSAMPNAAKIADKIFQISCVITKNPEVESSYNNYLLSLGDPDQKIVGENINIIRCRTEADIMENFRKLIVENQINVLSGYNILGFDGQYLINREIIALPIDFRKLSFVKNQICQQKTIKWSSSAFKNQQFEYLDMEGRIQIDLLPLVKRDYKFSNYKLKTIAEYFVKDTKDDLSPQGIFKCYRIGTIMQEDGTYSEKARKAMGICGKYCMKDSILVAKLLYKMQTWIGLTEMASVCNIQPFELFTKGQSIRTMSQIYKYCMYNNIICERDAYKASEDEKYTGAYVFDPEPGKYDNVISVDFSSLYPSTIIAYNLCMSTFVDDPTIPDSMCNIFEWHDCTWGPHDPKYIRYNELTQYIEKEQEKIKKLRAERDKAKCDKKEELKTKIAQMLLELKPYTQERSALSVSKPKKTICANRRYRFLKEPRGVLPNILVNLLDARKSTKKLMKSVDPSDILYSVYDKRQLAYKVSCNSVYGAVGASFGISHLPTAMTTTYMGRTNIQIVAKTITEQYGGKLIYGDSVTGDTPILIKYNNDSIDLINIEKLGNNWFDYDQFKSNKDGLIMKEQCLVDVSVWSNGEWTKIKRIIRHKTDKKIYRVLTDKGCVDVTEDHSLLDENINMVKPIDADKNTKLLHSFPNIFDEFDTFAIESSNKNINYTSGISYKQAYLWGLLMNYGIFDMKNYILKINTDNIIILEKIKAILYTLEKVDNAQLNNKNIISTCKLIVTKYHQLIEPQDYKSVPYPILNASYDIKKQFLYGYMCNNKIITCNSKIGTQGLYILLKSIGYNVKIDVTNNNKNIYVLNVLENKLKTNVKQIIEQKRTIDYVYDLETEKGIFHAGIGEIIVKNTDSNYVSFPALKTSEEIWDHSVNCAKEISKLFPKPIELLFEDAIYSFFFILTKKRYMYRACGRDGIVSDKIGKKGVLLARRDNSKFVRDVYEHVIFMISENEPKEKVYDYVLEQINILCSNSLPYTDFVVTKSVGSTGDLRPEFYNDEKGKLKAKVGDYTVPALSKDKEERKQQLEKKDAINEHEYYLSCLPAQVQLAERMRQRGMRVDAGSRLEYVVTTNGGHNAKQYEKVESAEYFEKYRHILRIDTLYYLKALANPLDQVLETAFKEKDFVLKQYNYRLKIREKVLDVIRYYSKPKIVFN